MTRGDICRFGLRANRRVGKGLFGKKACPGNVVPAILDDDQIGQETNANDATSWGVHGQGEGIDADLNNVLVGPRESDPRQLLAVEDLRELLLQDTEHFDRLQQAVRRCCTPFNICICLHFTRTSTTLL